LNEKLFFIYFSYETTLSVAQIVYRRIIGLVNIELRRIRTEAVVA
jgi:hypothetical protein